MSERELREWVRSLDGIPASHPVRDAILRLLSAGPGARGDDAKMAEGVDAALRLVRRVDMLANENKRLTELLGELAAQKSAMADRVRRLEDQNKEFADKLVRQTAELRNQATTWALDGKTTINRIVALEAALEKYKGATGETLTGLKAALGDIITIVRARPKESFKKKPKPEKPATRQKARSR